MSKKKRVIMITLLVAAHELLMIITGMGIALMIESHGNANGTFLIIPLAILLITLGWMIRDMRK